MLLQQRLGYNLFSFDVNTVAQTAAEVKRVFLAITQVHSVVKVKRTSAGCAQSFGNPCNQPSQQGDHSTVQSAVPPQVVIPLEPSQSGREGYEP